MKLENHAVTYVLGRHMKRLRLKQGPVAVCLGLSVSSMSRILNFKRVLNVVDIDTFCKVYGIGFEDFIEEVKTVSSDEVIMAKIAHHIAQAKEAIFEI